VTVCFGSDWTVAPLDALAGIHAAVTRSTLDGKNAGGWIPEQKLTVEQAVRCYTANNATAAFEEREKGTIEAGKLADLVVLNEDIYSIDPSRINSTRVDMTVLDGQILYQR
jgi:predicted amidohydrolase YtcJ